MSKKWDYDVPTVDLWKEVFRVLKPGGHMLCACGTRTQHRMVVNVEDAGFEIRDIVSWIYGSGFPKSLDVGKAVDKLQGNKRKVVDRRDVGHDITSNAYRDGKKKRMIQDITVGSSEYEGWGTALKPAQELFTLARKPISEKTIAANVLKWGTGAINIDDCRIGIDKEIDDKRLGGNGTWSSAKMAKNVYEGGYSGKRVSSSEKGRYPANVIHDGHQLVLDLFPDNCGAQAPVKGTEPSHTGQNGIYNPYGRISSEIRDKKGSAARFFKKIENPSCSICEDVQYDNDNLSLWKKLFANNAARNFTIINRIIEYSVQKNALPIINEEFVRNVKCAGNLCDLCATRIALALVGIKIWGFNQEELHLILGYIGNYKRCILIQNLVSFVEIWDNTDTILTIKNLLILFGSVQHAIENYIKKNTKEKGELKLEPSRFIYAAKASRSERGEGNDHATVKPIKLMEYLVRLITPPMGTVLDCFAGSGTTGLACQNLGFDSVLIEREEAYCDIIKSRINGKLR